MLFSQPRATTRTPPAFEGVVLAAEGDDEDAAGVGMAGEGGEEVGRHLVVRAELRAAVGMREGEAAAGGGEAFAEAVDAADGGDDPDVVADADAAVGVAVGHDRGRGLAGEVGEVRLVAVLQHIAKVGGEVVDMDMFAGGDVARGVSDRHAVLDYGLAGSDGAAGVLVPVVMDLDVV